MSEITEIEYLGEESERDKEFRLWQDYLVNLSCNIYGIPPSLLGISSTIKIDENKNIKEIPERL